MRKLISSCPKCDGITFMAVYDTPDEIIDAASSIKMLKKQNRSIDILEHEPTDPMPKWCDCE